MTELSANERGMSVIVRTVARWLRTPILVYGIYTVLYGHLSPGGGFAGGVMIATGLTLGTLAFGEPRDGIDETRDRAAALGSVGALLFLAAACVGSVTSGTFFESRKKMLSLSWSFWNVIIDLIGLCISLNQNLSCSHSLFLELKKHQG